jgi:hypothetical protein
MVMGGQTLSTLLYGTKHSRSIGHDRRLADVSFGSRMGTNSRPFTGWGVVFADLITTAVSTS